MCGRFNKLLSAVVLLALASIPPAIADSHIGKQVSAIHSPDSRPCTFFKLNGVTDADSATPGNPWFAVPQTHLGYDEILSMLITAYTTQTQMSVVTSGLSCGHASVSYVIYE